MKRQGFWSLVIRFLVASGTMGSVFDANLTVPGGAEVCRGCFIGCFKAGLLRNPSPSVMLYSFKILIFILLNYFLIYCVVIYYITLCQVISLFIYICMFLLLLLLLLLLFLLLILFCCYCLLLFCITALKYFIKK